MSDADTRGEAWRVAPSAYLAGRAPAFALPARPASCYVTMPDGVRLAVDVYLPEPRGGARRAERVPTIAILTPYYRRFKLRAGATGEPSPNAGRYRDMFVPRGYAVVVVDVRGTGASFGTRDGFRSPREREDYRALADWIVAQPWSNGAIGATGISYLGAAADFLASTGHPAVKAIAPLFAVWDTYADNYYPGGILLKELTRVYDELMVGLDHDRRDLLARTAYYNSPDLEGPQPVDDDADGTQCRAAVREHLANFRQTDFMAEFRFRDDTLPYDPGFTSASFSPYNYCAGVRPEVAIYSVSGWMDGAGYANGAIARFLTLAGNRRHLLLGPWDHGARINVSPWRARPEPEFDLLGEILRFFDTYLMGRETGLEGEQPIHYFSLHEERWRAAPAWPAVEPARRWHLGADGALAANAGAPGSDRYQVDFAIGTGHQTRYERIAAVDSRDYYADWQGRDAHMLSYSSAPLAEALELTGHAIVTLAFEASEPDAALFLYLSEVEPDGRVRYVTEGLLRALHRKEAPCPPSYRATWPFRSFARADAAPLAPGRRETVRVPLLPTSWTFAHGSRIRLSLAGADADHCGQVPHGRPPRLTVFRGGDASWLDLPVRPA